MCLSTDGCFTRRPWFVLGKYLASLGGCLSVSCRVIIPLGSLLHLHRLDAVRPDAEMRSRVGLLCMCSLLSVTRFMHACAARSNPQLGWILQRGKKGEVLIGRGGGLLAGLRGEADLVVCVVLTTHGVSKRELLLWASGRCSPAYEVCVGL